jgi:hypothetical protein
MSGKSSGDHLNNTGPIKGGGKGGTSRANRRWAERKGEQELGRDELFRQRTGAIPKAKRYRVEGEK